MAEAILDEWQIALLQKKSELEACQKEKHLQSCMKCEKLLVCEVREAYVKAVYDSMNKGTGGGFEFQLLSDFFHIEWFIVYLHPVWRYQDAFAYTVPFYKAFLRAVCRITAAFQLYLLHRVSQRTYNRSGNYRNSVCNHLPYSIRHLCNGRSSHLKGNVLSQISKQDSLNLFHARVCGGCIKYESHPQVRR